MNIELLYRCLWTAGTCGVTVTLILILTIDLAVRKK